MKKEYHVNKRLTVMIYSLQPYSMKNSRNIPEKEKKKILTSKILAFFYRVLYNYIIEVLKLISRKTFKEFYTISVIKIS